ncbi:hypothetical protein NC653_004571 [Populus alba x Populus x berolinensis]|uniref:Uncharacterized protein n=1 Tax=Populus alba x Populus x berolinensis TaxID=444605 RepID=A0AAD6RUC1_9ROSI|nr:hypothetical protein NC653_004571 [Populus alba x Populus x berolinensis]
MFASIAIGYDKKIHDHFSDGHPCWLVFIFTLVRNILYVNFQHSFECNLARNLSWVPLPKMLQIGDAKDKLGVLKFSGQVLVRQEISVKAFFGF